MDIRGKLVSIVGTVLSVAAIVTAWVMGDRHGVKKVHEFQEGVIADLEKDLENKKSEIADKDAEIDDIKADKDVVDKKAAIAPIRKKADLLGEECKIIQLKISDIKEVIQRFKNRSNNCEANESI